MELKSYFNKTIDKEIKPSVGKRLAITLENIPFIAMDEDELIYHGHVSVYIAPKNLKMFTDRDIIDIITNMTMSGLMEQQVICTKLQEKFFEELDPYQVIVVMKTTHINLEMRNTYTATCHSVRGTMECPVNHENVIFMMNNLK